MSAIILTGLSYGKHKFSLTYPEVEGVVICMAQCQCGYQVEILYFKNYGGVKYIQRKWEEHIGIWKGWIQVRILKFVPTSLNIYPSTHLGQISNSSHIGS